MNSLPFNIRWIEETDWLEVEGWGKEVRNMADWLPRNPLTIVAERDGKLAGVVSMTWGPWGYGTIEWLARNPMPIGRGSGRFLVKAALVLLELVGMKAAYGVVGKDLPRVMALHRSIPGVYEDEMEYHLFWKQLGGE